MQTRDGASVSALRSRYPHWIVGRGLCMYRCEDFGSVPRNKRRSALELRIPVWSPFKRTGYHCVWSGSSAMVWYWDEDKIAAAREAEGGTRPGAGARAPAGVRVLPETVFHARKAEGFSLQPCREGFELQHWRAGLLLDSFWYPERPRARQVAWFIGRQEGEADVAPSGAVPEAPEAELAPEPWTTSRTLREWIEANERALVAALLLALTLAAVWQEARIWKVRHLEEAAAADFADLQNRLGPRLEARNEFLRLRQTNRALAAILNEPSQAYLMLRVDRALPNAEAEFREWSYQQRKLSVVVEEPDPDPVAYVRALQAERLFEKVRAEPSRGENQLEITLEVQG